MINGIRIDGSVTIVNEKSMTERNQIDFAFLQARDGVRDNPNWAADKLKLKELVGKFGVILTCCYSDLAYSPTSPSGSAQAIDLFNLTHAGGAYLFHLPLGIFLSDQPYTSGNNYPVVDKPGYIQKAVDMIETIKNMIGRNPILISTPGFLNNLGTLPKNFYDCPLYVAHWGAKFPIIGLWKQYSFWEQSAVDDWSGVNGRVYSIGFPSDRANLKKWAFDPTASIPGGYPENPNTPVASTSPSPSHPQTEVCPEGKHWDNISQTCVDNISDPNQDINSAILQIAQDVRALRVMTEAVLSGIKTAAK